MVNDQQMDLWTFDDRHPEEEVRLVRQGSKLIAHSNTLHQHINGNFAVLRRFIEHINRKFGGGKQFDVIAMDHFNGPTGWAGEKWVEGFIGEVMPYIGTNCLSRGGEVWLPRIPAVIAAIQKHTKKLTRSFTIEYALPACNPIYAAGEAVASQLEAQRPPVCNLNAMRSLPEPYPFVLFRLNRSVDIVVAAASVPKVSSQNLTHIVSSVNLTCSPLLPICAAFKRAARGKRNSLRLVYHSQPYETITRCFTAESDKASGNRDKASGRERGARRGGGEEF